MGPLINFCKPGPMSTCDAGKTWKDQVVCQYSVKSDHSERCMYFRESMGNHCDCVAAQVDGKSRLENKKYEPAPESTIVDEELLIEAKEGVIPT